MADFTIGERIWWHSNPYEPSYSLDEIKTGIIKELDASPRGGYESGYLLVGEETPYDDEYKSGYYVKLSETYTSKEAITKEYATFAREWGTELLKRASILEQASNEQ